MLTSKSNGGPGLQRMTNTVGPEGTEVIRQKVLADQSAARAAVAKSTKAKAKPKTPAPATKAKAKTAAPTKAAAPAPKAKGAAGGTITVVAKSNPHAAGSRRAGWFRQLKTGMTVAEAVELGVRSIYLRRMDAKGVIKITK